MQTFANQCIVITNRLANDDKDAPFTIMFQASQQAAMRDLKKVGAVKLWYYLAKNKPGFPLALSQKACEDWGITINEYRSGKQELKEKGYLVPRDNSNQVDFYEYPFAQNPEIVKERAERNKKQISEFADLFRGDF